MTTFLKHLEKRRGLNSRIFTDSGMSQIRKKERKKRYGFDLYENKLFNKTNSMMNNVFHIKNHNITSNIKLCLQSFTFEDQLWLLICIFSHL